MSTTTTRQAEAFKAYADGREYAEETFDEAHCGRCEHCGGDNFNSPCERCGAARCCDPCCRETTAVQIGRNQMAIRLRRKARKLAEEWEETAELIGAAPVGMDKMRYERYDTLRKCASDLRRRFGVED